MAVYCLDASFVVPYLSLANAEVIKRWRSFAGIDELVAPPLLRIECTTAFVRLAHTGRITDADARDLVDDLLALPIRAIERLDLYPRAFEIARSLGQSKAYDALYLATSELEQSELLTVDGGMRDAAHRLGLPVTLVS